LTFERTVCAARGRATADLRGLRLARALKCHANMRLRRQIRQILGTCAVTAVTVLATAASARADEPSRFGLSVDAYAAPVYDRSVINQQTHQPVDGSRETVGLATVLNFDTLALGGVVDGMPGILGNGRLAVGGIAGWQPRLGSHRYQLMGELGAERFGDVGGSLLGTPGARDTWLDYVGARLGTSETFGSGPFELGAWLFVRKDLGEANVSGPSGNLPGGPDSTTDYRLGGYTAGVALRLGVRFDQKRAPADPPMEAEAESI
jgi:hypothetical protein